MLYMLSDEEERYVYIGYLKGEEHLDKRIGSMQSNCPIKLKFYASYLATKEEVQKIRMHIGKSWMHSYWFQIDESNEIIPMLKPRSKTLNVGKVRELLGVKLVGKEGLRP